MTVNYFLALSIEICKERSLVI